MDDAISRQVLDLWNRYRPTIAVDAIEYDRELKKLLSTNLAEVGTDAISRQQAIDAINEYMVGKRCDTDGTMMARLINELVIKQLPPIQPDIVRCKDCDWWTKQEDSLQGRCGLFQIYPTGGWFCGSARRREVTT